MKLVLTSLGEPPAYLDDCLAQIRFWNPTLPIVLLTDITNLQHRWGKHGVILHRFCGSQWMEAIKEASFHKGLSSPKTVYPSPPNWLFNTMARLFLLCDYLELHQGPIWHIESDVMLYCDLWSLLPEFKKINRFAATLATDQHMSCAFCWIPTLESLQNAQLIC